MYPDCGYSILCILCLQCMHIYIYIQNVYTVTGRLIRYVHMLHVTPQEKEKQEKMVCIHKYTICGPEKFAGFKSKSFW